MKRQRREPVVLSQMRPITLFFVLCGCILVTFCLINFSSVAAYLKKIFSALAPVFVGFVLAYLLNPAATWAEKRLMRLLRKPIQRHPKLAPLPRALGSLLIVLLFLGSVVLLIIATFSQVVDGISRFWQALPGYVTIVTEWVQQLFRRDSSLNQYLEIISNAISNSQFGVGQVDTMDMTQRILSMLATGAAGTFGFVYNAVIGTVVAVYLLISKERFVRQWKQLLYAVLKPKTAAWVDKQMGIANQTFGTAVLGKLIDSLIIGLFCFIGVTIIGAPYSVLISVIIGVTNVIPYFGPIFGAIPCFLLILMEAPMKALYFAIFIIALQQFDANILDPRIVGQSIGLPAFWELFACLLGGGLFGIIGLMIGVPAFAVLYGLIRQLVTEKLEERAAAGELEQTFLSESLGVTEPAQKAGFFEEDDPESEYVQHLVLLEEIAETPAKKKETKS